MDYFYGIVMALMFSAFTVLHFVRFRRSLKQFQADEAGRAEHAVQDSLKDAAGSASIAGMLLILMLASVYATDDRVLFGIVSVLTLILYVALRQLAKRWCSRREIGWW